MLLIRRKWLPLLFIGFLTSFFLAFYLVNVEKKTLFSKRRLVKMLPTIPSQENDEVASPSNSSEDSRFKLYDGVEAFVLFIGYPRSSHSLVGAILDAHPEIIIPHEYNVIGKWQKYQSPKLKQQNTQKYVLFRDLHQRSKKQVMSGIRASANNTQFTGEFTYTYHVPGLWQGGYQKRIKVIGDKKGGHTSMLLRYPSRIGVLEEINQVVQVPMKFIHVTRNPFDNIATMMLRASGSRNTVREEGVKKNNTRFLETFITLFFELAASNQRIRERYGDAVLDVPGHEIVLRPRETLQRLCDHLGVTCSEDYFDKCSKIMYGTPSVTRDKVVWTNEQIKRITEMMKSYPFMKDYSFDKYPS